MESVADGPTVKDEQPDQAPDINHISDKENIRPSEPTEQKEEPTSTSETASTKQSCATEPQDLGTAHIASVIIEEESYLLSSHPRLESWRLTIHCRSDHMMLSTIPTTFLSLRNNPSNNNLLKLIKRYIKHLPPTSGSWALQICHRQPVLGLAHVVKQIGKLLV